MSNQQGENRWLIGIVVILVIALVGAVCIGVGALFFLQQQPQVAGQSTPGKVPTSRSVAPAGGKVLRLPGLDDPQTLDPARTSDSTSASYIVEIFSGLVTLDQDLKVVPDIAEKWDISEDRKVYTFHLRNNVTFHDGRAVTAQDFKYSIERAADPTTLSPVAETYLDDIVGVKDKLNRKASEVSGVKVIDNFTLEITINTPVSYFLAKLTYPTSFVIDKNNVERGGRTWTDKPNGTGPYKLTEYVRGQRIVLSKNNAFYLDPKPQVEEIDFILGGGSFMTMYENGDLESTFVTINDFERVTDPSGPLNKELFVGPSLSTFFVVMNNKKPPFDDPKVRQAFTLAIDRSKVINVTFKKMLPPAYTILPPKMPGYAEPTSQTPFDAARAKQLLAESKYAGKLPEITWTTSGAGGLVQAIVGQWKENLGVSVSIQQTDSATYQAELDNPNKSYQMFDIGWVADYVDPQDFVDILFRSGSRPQNWASYSNPTVDGLIDKANVEKDLPTRLKLYQQAEQLILNDYPVIPLYYSQEYWLTKPYVKGLTYPPLVIPRLRFVSLVK